ncbi:hypothetical protein [Faecalibacter sp. LW9]|uniref:hypothetical protein n=1 Tax=Faecalibacter sp. LW9 TaxID=3103144 RepID=UPI002AFE5C07|nr:hypothetical protein [Faecalibacter sp. LW9]
MKLTLYLLFILTTTISLAQDNFKFPTYPGCEKRKKNDELKKCFHEKLTSEIKFGFEDQVQFWINKKTLTKTELVFTITSNGKLTNFSYTKESDPESAKFFLQQIYRVKKYYDSKNKKFSPGLKNGKPIDFQIRYYVSY